MHGETMKKA